MRHTYSAEELHQAAASSTSYRQVLQKLGIAPAGGNYSTLKKRMSNLSVDISHFLFQGWRKEKILPRVDIQEYLTNRKSISSFKLKAKLFKLGLKSRQCEGCSNIGWRGKPIPLELDHINGNSSDNNLENLRILCPNCHAQTSTYRGKNIRKLGSGLPC